jgi:hypothetical protein
MNFIAIYRMLEELDEFVDSTYHITLQADSLLLARAKAEDLTLPDEELVSVTEV